MSDKPKEFQDSKELAVCVKDRDGQVLIQNELCESMCGKRSGFVCKDGCMQLFKRELTGQNPMGAQVFHFVEIGNRKVDIAMTFDGNRIVTLMVPLDSAIESHLQSIVAYGLSPREAEIAVLVMTGKQNREIAKQLHISLSTVKKHLFNIYAKMPTHEISVWRSSGKTGSPR